MNDKTLKYLEEKSISTVLFLLVLERLFSLVIAASNQEFYGEMLKVRKKFLFI